MAEAQQVQSGDTVRMHFTGRAADGRTFGSQEDQPLEFQVGTGNVPVGLEQAVVGMRPGEEKTVAISAENAFGNYREEWVLEIGRQELPADFQPEIGQILHLQTGAEQPVPIAVIAVAEDKITVDANHPLAGQDVTFDLRLMEIVGESE